jgi:hypothetical protein
VKSGINFNPSTCPSSFIDLVEKTREVTLGGNVVSRRKAFIPDAVEAQRAGDAAYWHRERMIRSFGGVEQPDYSSSQTPTPTYERELSVFERRRMFGSRLLVVSDMREVTVDPESDFDMYVMPVRYQEEGLVAKYIKDRVQRITLHLDPSNPVIVENRDVPKPSKLIEWAGELLVSINDIARET